MFFCGAFHYIKPHGKDLYGKLDTIGRELSFITLCIECFSSGGGNPWVMGVGGAVGFSALFLKRI